MIVDSGDSETVVPVELARQFLLLHTPRVGTEYEVANGGVVVVLGEKQDGVVAKLGNTILKVMSFQVVEVHKPFLVVSRLVEVCYKVRFD